MKRRSVFSFVPLFALAMLSFSLNLCAAGEYSVYGLKVCGMTEPRGIDRTPVFGWRLRSGVNGAEQTVCRIIVKDEDGALMWDSGEIQGKKPFGIAYAGKPLESNGFYTWKVISEDNFGHKAKSAPQTFSTGLLKHSEWTADWIEITEPRKPLLHEHDDMGDLFRGRVKDIDPEIELDPAICFRKEFTVGKKVKRATAYATAHGIYNLYFNGTLVSELYAPGITTYPHYLEYQQYDVTRLLSKGENVLGAVVADGWWTGKISNNGLGDQFGDRNGLLCQLIVEYADGTSEVIGTDKDFKWNNDGAFRYSDLYEGEEYDAGKELTGWTKPGYDDSLWKPVQVSEYDNSVLTGRRAEPVRAARTIKAQKVIVTPKGETVIDFGENIVGRMVSHIHGKAGQKVTFIHQESLDKDGNLNYGIFRPEKHQRNRYIFASDGEASYTPQFTFQGFRYVLVDGLDYLPSAEDFQVEVIGTDMEKTGDFSCSDPMLTQLQKNIFRSQAGNMLSIPTDCPHREKAGWTGDMQIYAATATYNMDVEAFLDKWLTGMRFDQREDGGIPDITPILPKFPNQFYSAGWSDAAVVVPWRLYEAYGDLGVLEDNWNMMTKWTEYLIKSSPDGLRTDGHFQYGDWALPKVPEKYSGSASGHLNNLGSDLVANAYLVQTLDIMAEAAAVLGKADKAGRYKDYAAKVRKAFSCKYVNDRGELELDMQGLYVVALAMNMVREDLRPEAGRKLLEIMHDEYGDHLNTGFLTTPYLMDVLLGIDKDYAMKILFQKTAPSWLYEVSKGATTVWEDWFEVREDGSRSNSSMNHFAYGCVGDFIYREVLGLDKASPAYEKIVVDPVFPEQLDWAEGWHETPYGRVSVRWERKDGGISLEVTVPPGCEAEVHDGFAVRNLKSGKYKIFK